MDLTEGNQPKTMENLGSQPQKKEVIEPGKLRVIKRNGSVVNFDSSKIDVAITKAFLAVHTSAAAASSSVQKSKRTVKKRLRNFFKSYALWWNHPYRRNPRSS